MILLFAGCGNKPGTQTSQNYKSGNPDENKDLTIVTSFYPMYLHVINITRDIPDIKVINLTQSQTGCLHDYSLTTDNMKTLEKAQVLVVNGAGMENFLDKLVKQKENLNIIEASKGLELLNDEKQGEVNAHVWVGISGAIDQVKNIGNALAAIDTVHAEQYKTNVLKYVEKLNTLKNKMHEALDNVPNKDIVTFHEAFPYFAKEFNLHIAAVIEREPDSAPSAQELAETVNVIKASNVKILFAEPQFSNTAAETIARETGAKLYILDPVVTGEANNDYDAYIKAMEKNLITLQEALK